MKHNLIVTRDNIVVETFLLKTSVLTTKVTVTSIESNDLCLNLDYSVFLRLSRRLAPGLLLLFPAEHVTPARMARVHVPAAHGAGNNEDSYWDHVTPARTARVHVPTGYPDAWRRDYCYYSLQRSCCSSQDGSGACSCGT
jgi:hypothetical protein